MLPGHQVQILARAVLATFCKLGRVQHEQLQLSDFELVHTHCGALTLSEMHSAFCPSSDVCRECVDHVDPFVHKGTICHPDFEPTSDPVSGVSHVDPARSTTIKVGESGLSD